MSVVERRPITVCCVVAPSTNPLVSFLYLLFSCSFEEDAGPYRPYSSARASSDFSFKQAESAPQDYRMPTSRSYHARVSTGISPSRSAPISSHEQGNFNLGHRLHSLANLGYRDVLERGRAGFAPELRS